MNGIDFATLIEDGGFVSLAISAGVFKNENTVSLRALVTMAPVVDDLANPHPTEVVDVNAGGAEHHRLGGEECSLQTSSDIEICDRFFGGLLARGGGRESRKCGENRESASDACVHVLALARAGPDQQRENTLRSVLVELSGISPYDQATPRPWPGSYLLTSKNRIEAEVPLLRGLFSFAS